MKPISPIVPQLESFEVVIGANQPEYQPLPVLIGRLPTMSFISRWQPTDDERAAIAAGADIYSVQHTFGHPFQPLLLIACAEEQNPESVVNAFGVGELLPSSNIDAVLDKTL